jgi:hypothetical protein
MKVGCCAEKEEEENNLEIHKNYGTPLHPKYTLHLLLTWMMAMQYWTIISFLVSNLEHVCHTLEFHEHFGIIIFQIFQ